MANENPIQQLNILERQNMSQGNFERQAKAIIAGTKSPSVIGKSLDEGIKSSPNETCINFYTAINALKNDSSLALSPEREEQLSHLAQVAIIETLAANGYNLRVWDSGKYGFGKIDKEKAQLNTHLLAKIRISNVSDAEKVLATIEEHKKELTEIITPKIAPVQQRSKTQRQTLALQINTGGTPRTQAAELLRSAPQGGSFWSSIFGDGMISRNANENAVPLMGLAAFIGISKMFGLFDLFGGDEKADEKHGEHEAHGKEHSEKPKKTEEKKETKAPKVEKKTSKTAEEHPEEKTPKEKKKTSKTATAGTAHTTAETTPPETTHAVAHTEHTPETTPASVAAADAHAATGTTETPAAADAHATTGTTETPATTTGTT